MRIALLIEYDGSQFYGWQRQPNLRTVQCDIEEAVSKVADHPITVICAGRTDTGVHAMGQIVHFDTSADRNLRAWVHGTNSFLSHEITVHWAKLVQDDFHARFSAIRRTYYYYLCNRAMRPSLLRTNTAWQYRSLDNDAMHTAAQALLGEHDFTAFRAINCQSKSPYRNLESLNVIRRGDWLRFEVTANAFLYHMVRNLVGALILIGTGKYPPEWLATILHSKKRGPGVETAPPYGLYLAKVDYPEEDLIQADRKDPFFW